MRVSVSITLDGSDSEVGPALAAIGNALNVRDRGSVSAPRVQAPIELGEEPVVQENESFNPVQAEPKEAENTPRVRRTSTKKIERQIAEEIKANMAKREQEREEAAAKTTVGDGVAEDDTPVAEAEPTGSESTGEGDSDEDGNATTQVIPAAVVSALKAGFGPKDGENSAAYLTRLQKLASDKSKLVGSVAVKAALAKTGGGKTLRQLAESDDRVLLPAVEAAFSELA